ncbi:MAG: hypothetical protein ACRDQZ_15525 [Mycobacteriales bacterium]
MSNNWAEFINKQDRWNAALGELLDEVDALLHPALPQWEDDWGVLTAEVARHEFWRGFLRAVSVREAPSDAVPDSLRADLRSLNSATGYFRRALELDPTLALVGYYNANRELAKVLTRMAELAVRLGQDPQDIEKYLREALERKPDHQDARDLLDRLFPDSGDAGR